MSTDSAHQPLAIVLAAGKGTRMESELPKVLVPISGSPMIDYVLDTLDAAGIKRKIVVVGYKSELVRQHLEQRHGVEFAEQPEQLGTGHAVMMCRKQFADHPGPVLIVTGDAPMLQASTVQKLLQAFSEEQPDCLLGTVTKENPSGFGRIVRDDSGRFCGIVEEKDATDQQREIREVNPSVYLFKADALLAVLDQLTAENAQREYYITDCPRLLLEAGKSVDARNVLQPIESLGVNSQADVQEVESALKRQESTGV